MPRAKGEGDADGAPGEALPEELPADAPLFWPGAPLAAVAAGAAMFGLLAHAGGAALHFLLLALLLKVAVTDAARYRIPNADVLTLLALRAASVVASASGVGNDLLGPLAGGGVSAGTALTAGLLNAAPVALLALISEARGAPAMGGGDLKLLFAIGTFFTPEENLLGLFVACLVAAILGLIQKRRTDRGVMPFGCGIAVGWWIVMLAGKVLMGAYL